MGDTHALSLSAARRRVLEAIHEANQTGDCPTYAEVCHRVERTPNAVFQVVRDLVEAGLLEPPPVRRSRSLRLTELGREALDWDIQRDHQRHVKVPPRVLPEGFCRNIRVIPPLQCRHLSAMVSTVARNCRRFDRKVKIVRSPDNLGDNFIRCHQCQKRGAEK